MRKSEARAHALAWLGAAENMKKMPSPNADTDRLRSVAADLARKVGESYAAISEGTHPVTGTALTDFKD